MICLPPSRWLLLAIWLLWRQNCLQQLAALQLINSCVLQSSVAGPEKKLEKAIDLAYTCTTLVHVQLCSHVRPAWLCGAYSVNSSSTVAWMTPRHGLHLYFYLLSCTCYSKNNVMFLLSVECRFQRYPGWPSKIDKSNGAGTPKTDLAIGTNERGSRR